MMCELKVIFDDVVKKEDWCSREEIRIIASRVGEQPDELDDQIDLLEFDEDTNLIEWEYFYEWWSEDVDPRLYNETTNQP